MFNSKVLLTAGYAGLDPAAFLRRLRGNGVDVVVDVRQNPVSRKKGFSRSSLSKFLIANGIDYLHEPELGVPVELRQKLKRGEQDLASYFQRFRQHLSEHPDPLDRVYALALRKRCCLICLEHLPQECHRSVVAQAVMERNGHRLTVVHI